MSSGERPLSEVRFLTVAEVAAVMRVSKMTVYRLVHSGELPAVWVGRSFRVPEDAVNEDLHRSFFQTGCPRGNLERGAERDFPLPSSRGCRTPQDRCPRSGWSP